MRPALSVLEMKMDMLKCSSGEKIIVLREWEKLLGPQKNVAILEQTG